MPDRLTVTTAALLRLLVLLPWPLTLLLNTESGLQWPLLGGLTAAGYAVWSLLFAGTALIAGGFARWALPLELSMTLVALVLGGLACYPHDATSWADFAVTPAMATAAILAALWPAKWAAPAVVILMAGYLGGLSRGFADGTAAGSVAAVNCLSLLVFAVAGFLLRRLLAERAAARAQAERLASLPARLAAAEEWIETERRRDQERVKQYRMLHDTVLSTLSALARGGLDPADPAVRQRCAADADYLRALISSGGVSAGNRLQGELAALGRAQGALGLRVHLHSADVPAELPAEAARALVDATREALNNVLKHSGVTQAWVTALGDEQPAGVSLTIVDRGRGFDPARVAFGLGLRDSIDRRMAEAGGSATVDSSPGQGTSVELRWPR